MTCERRTRSDEENADGLKKRKSGIFFEESDEELGKRRKLQQIDREFKTLKSLVPDVANKAGISKLEIIDASVRYIEELRTKLKPSDQERINSSVRNEEEASLDEEDFLSSSPPKNNFLTKIHSSVNRI